MYNISYYLFYHVIKIKLLKKREIISSPSNNLPYAATSKAGAKGFNCITFAVILTLTLFNLLDDVIKTSHPQIVLVTTLVL